MIEALLDLQFAEPDRANAFNCQECPKAVKKLRRCEENREFTIEDGNIWPMRVSPGGNLYGFCPGKAQQNIDAVEMYKTLLLCAETGAMWDSGGISDQPVWWVELASEFLPRYNDYRFYSRTKTILGDGKHIGGQHHGSVKAKRSGLSNRR